MPRPARPVAPRLAGSQCPRFERFILYTGLQQEVFKPYGTYIRAGIDIEPSPNIPLLNPKTNKPYRVSEKPWKVDVRPVVVQGNRILRARPRFDDWTLEFKIVNLDPGLLKRDMIHKILVDAGRFYGLMDFRPEFGLFKVEKFGVVARELQG